MSSLKTILYLHKSIIKFQRNFVLPSINYQVSQWFCTCMNQLSSFKITLHLDQLTIKFQTNFVAISIYDQVSNLYPHRSISKFRKVLYRHWSIFNLKLFCDNIHHLTSFKLLSYSHPSIMKVRNESNIIS